ncbi:hypothetical protein ABTX86_16630 [Streptomyces anulatus]|uniref:hypothetical protein n=1 Tax=Streptomyces anulatus TaxID=1892 RepID=UPI00194295F5|nr:hypothetical protein [Streptomyces anulatus]
MSSRSSAFRSVRGVGRTPHRRPPGNPPSGAAFEATGLVTLRFRHGRIAGSRLGYAVAGALEQVGAPPATGP